jgi:hypothetical protein
LWPAPGNQHFADAISALVLQICYHEKDILVDGDSKQANLGWSLSLEPHKPTCVAIIASR